MFPTMFSKDVNTSGIVLILIGRNIKADRGFMQKILLINGKVLLYQTLFLELEILNVLDVMVGVKPKILIEFSRLSSRD